MRKRILIGMAGGLLALSAVGGVALADDGSVMSRVMGHEAYAAMVVEMRAVLGDARTDAMLAHCEEQVGQNEMTPGAAKGMSGMMRNMGGAMGSGR